MKTLKQQIENKYRNQFENYTFQQVIGMYENDVSVLKFCYESDISRKPGDFGYPENLMEKDHIIILLVMYQNIFIFQVKKIFYNILKI